MSSTWANSLNGRLILPTTDNFLRTVFQDAIDGTRSLICHAPSLSGGLGADLYALLGGSLGGGGHFDLSTGRVGVDFNAAVGVGTPMAEVGPYAGLSPGNTSAISANLTTTTGGGALVGASVTHNWIGTDAGQSSLNVGKLSTPGFYANGGGAVSFGTPKLYDACKDRN